MNEQFFKVMEEIKALDENDYTWLVDHDPNTWCRAYFEVDRSCATFKNGIYGSFNSKILSARGKPIITMLEDIRVYIMQRVWFLNMTAMELNDSITPFARGHLEFMKIRQRKWVVCASGFQEIEVRRQDEAFGVNIHLKKCACKMWELTGLPCMHVVAGYIHLKKDPELGVTEWFLKNKWIESYQYFIRPVPGSKLWKKSDLPKPLLPGERKLPGRPRKRRIGHPLKYDHEISRVGRVMHCHRQHGSNEVRERDQYQQDGPSVDKIPKYREDTVMPESSSGEDAADAVKVANMLMMVTLSLCKKFRQKELSCGSWIKKLPQSYAKLLNVKIMIFLKSDLRKCLCEYVSFLIISAYEFYLDVVSFNAFSDEV
nr:hypothetical protein [Tanacetum cinerariifolium]